MARVGVGLSSLAVSICLFGGTADSQVRGRLAFESFQATARGLDYNNPMEKPVRRARVLLVDAASETILAETVTGNDGSFSFSQSGSGAKLVVLAQTLDPAIRVEDNTDNNLTWAAESPPLQGSENINLLIPSGWNGSAYSEARVSGPFAILDAVMDRPRRFATLAPSPFLRSASTGVPTTGPRQATSRTAR